LRDLKKIQIENAPDGREVFSIKKAFLSSGLWIQATEAVGFNAAHAAELLFYTCNSYDKKTVTPAKTEMFQQELNELIAAT
jgi:hypothetical protein